MKGDAVSRYNGLFLDVPLSGGEEWTTMKPKELMEQIFLPAVNEGLEFLEKKNAAATEVLNNYNTLPWYKWIFTKRPPAPKPVPTRAEIIAEMVSRCRSLANWMDANKNRRFYMDSDMSAYINGPRAVALLLEQS